MFSDQRLSTVHGQSITITQVMSRYRLIDRPCNSMATHNGAPASAQVCEYAHTGVQTTQRRFTRDYNVSLNTFMATDFRRPIASLVCTRLILFDSFPSVCVVLQIFQHPAANFDYVLRVINQTRTACISGCLCHEISLLFYCWIFPYLGVLLHTHVRVPQVFQCCKGD